MNSTITITPNTNIDYNKMCIIKDELVSKITFKDKDTIKIFDKKDEEEKNIYVINVSLFDHLLILDGERYKMLHLFGK